MMRKLGTLLFLMIVGAATMALTGPGRVLDGLDRLDGLDGLDKLTGSASTAAPEASPAPALPTPPLGVSALGRLEPEGGVFRIAGPSTPVVVIGELLVDDGDVVEAGQTLATLDALPLLEADVASLEAELAYERAELARKRELHQSRVVSEASRQAAETRVRVIEARLARARAELQRHLVRAPFDGQVIRIHARQGERVGDEGILEFGRTGAMVAIAEVYETDIDRVAIGQKAVIESPALPYPLTGRVDRIWLEVGKQDVLGTDPAARQDARVVEVQIRLDQSAPAARMSNLQVTVEIETGTGTEAGLEIATDLETGAVR